METSNIEHRTSNIESKAGKERRALLRATPHPLVPWEFTEADVANAPEALLPQILQMFHKREELIRLASDEGNPFLYGFDLPHWRDADRELRRPDMKGQYIGGGKRATKSERAAKRMVQAAMAFPKGRMWCMQGSEKTSIAEQQSLIWKYLPPEIKALNGKKRHGAAKINYSQDGGFTDRILVLPNRTEMHFLTYNQDYKEYQGWQLGAQLSMDMEDAMADRAELINLGAWLDEDATWEWVNTVRLRCTTRNAKWIWTFSPLMGITTAIKELIGVARTTESRPAELLSEQRRYVDDCPPGHMPYVQQAGTPGVSVLYFHTILNPFPPNYENVREALQGKPESQIMQDAYGYATDTKHRACPMFGQVHIVKPGQLPVTRLNVMVQDPAGNRNWCAIWVGVSSQRASNGKFKKYIYRDWPNAQAYGAWAVPSSNPNQFDGDRGPAQRSMGYGILQYKQEWLAQERVLPTGKRLDGTDEVDPYRVKLAAEAKEREVAVQEVIGERFIDPRAGRDAKISEDGGTCIIDLLGAEQRDGKSGEVIGPVMDVQPAKGLNEREGLSAINEMLHYDKKQDLDGVMNCPELYVSEECEQVIWALSNYTGTGGENAGCKDIMDLLRYLATADVQYYDATVRAAWGGGSY